MIRLTAAGAAEFCVALVLVFAATGCGGDDDNGNGGGEETAAAEDGDRGLSIDPQSGPASTTISWTISGCKASDEKGASIYAGPLERYEAGARSRRIIEGPRGKETSGNITVPDDTAPGEYVVTGSCLSTEELGGGEVQLGVSEETAPFTVTD